MTTRHYHVMSGLVGCLPDSNECYSTKRDAINATRAAVRGHRDDDENHVMFAKDAINYGTAYCHARRCVCIVELTPACEDSACEGWETAS